jgi:short-subunit dehydrogenase
MCWTSLRAPESPRRIAITGASGGLGHALAVVYARPGARLELFGRDAARLGSTVEACRAKGADARAIAVDATDREAMRNAMLALDHEGGIDLLIANAGVSSGRQPDGAPETTQSALRVLEVNVLGSAYAVAPALEAMAVRGHGQVALVGSLAARPPSPSSPAYSASKAALETWGLALREAYKPAGVRVSVVSPGFVRPLMGG